MPRDRSRRAGPPGAAVTGALALLLVVCLAECATGSCLKYGHSCWGAHGKRSAQPPAEAPDWFLSKLLRQVNANANNINHIRKDTDENDAIYRGDTTIDSPATNRLGSNNEDYSLELQAPRKKDAKPMLDDDLLAKIKMWKIMRETFM